MEGKIQVNSGDVSIIAVNVDGKDVTDIPQKGEGKRFDHADCSNGSTGNWDSTNWEFRIRKLTKTKTKCTLYFLTGEESTGGIEIENKIHDLVSDWVYGDQVVYEQEGEDNNIRFVGSDPDNYVTFNGEQWRIIGLMDNIETSTGKKEKLLKIIRKDSLGKYNWDKSASNINNGRGVNEWSQADLMYALKKYGGESVSNCGDSSCPSWGTLNSEAQSMIEEVTWNTGTVNNAGWTESITPLYMYSGERSTVNGKQCTNETYCNDSVERTTEWTGKIGLMYPSDYGLATSGGQLKKRKQCLAVSMYHWDASANNYCKINNWLYDSINGQWTMTPAPGSMAYYVFRVWDGYVYDYDAYANTYVVRPVVYLKSSVKITGGDGSSENPYKLSV